MSFKLNLIFVATIIWCFADQLSAQNVVPSNKLIELNETMVLPKNDRLLKVIVFDEKEHGEQKNTSNNILDDVNEKPKKYRVKIGKKRLANKDNHGSKYSKKHGEHKHKQQWEKEQGNKNVSHDTEHIKLHKWGKDKGQGMVKKWTWDREHGLTEVHEKNKGHEEENHQKSQEQKEGMKKYQEEKAKKHGIKHKYIIKEWKEHGKQNEDQAEKKHRMKSWNERKPDYFKYQKQLEQRGKKAQKYGYTQDIQNE